MAAMRRAIPITQVSKHIHYNRYDHLSIFKDLHRLWQPIKPSAYSQSSIGTKASLVLQQPEIRVYVFGMAIS